MRQVYVLYNPLSGDGCKHGRVEVVNDFFSGETVTYQDITKIRDYKALLQQLALEDQLVICGGDGTLNRFVNQTKHKTLPVFPSIFKGKHIDHTKTVALRRGRDISVKFDRPVTLQIDGEVVKNVFEYRAYSKVMVEI